MEPKTDYRSITNITSDVIIELRYYTDHDKILSRQNDRESIQQTYFEKVATGYSADCPEETGDS